MEIWLSEVKLRARRRIGEITKDLDKAANQHESALPSGGKTKNQTLKQAGISTSTANRCENPDCGIDGDNPNTRYGEWVSTNIVETLSTQTLLNIRLLHEVYGNRRKEVSHIPQSALYELAQPKCDEVFILSSGYDFRQRETVSRRSP